MEQLGHVLQTALCDLGIDKKLRKYEAMTLWPHVVGEKIAKVTHPVRFDQGKLIIQVKTPAWRNELLFHKSRIIADLNRELGETAVEDIVLI